MKLVTPRLLIAIVFPATAETPAAIPDTTVLPVAPTEEDIVILLFAVEIVTLEPFVIDTVPVNDDAPTATP